MVRTCVEYNVIKLVFSNSLRIFLLHHLLLPILIRHVMRKTNFQTYFGLNGFLVDNPDFKKKYGIWCCLLLSSLRGLYENF